MEENFGKDYENFYQSSWWFRVREKIILKEVRSRLKGHSNQILDVGCGNGLLFSKLEKFGQVAGIETDTKLLDPNSKHFKNIGTQPLGDSRYKKESQDLILALDVVEHIEDDTKAFNDIFDLLKPGGTLILTVPAFQMLWSEHDVLNHHFRRYTLDQIRGRAEKFEIEKSQYFFALLFPIKWLLVHLRLPGRRQIRQDKIRLPLIEKVLEIYFIFEFQLLRWMPLPFGSSILLIGTKKDLNRNNE
ncbi:MAG: class I SAM-dependent methyltransferase [Bdellovibrionales bacterium]|nr:class I SAM-dependent methyltransferase [Bdellovibrionales bacterium]